MNLTYEVKFLNLLSTEDIVKQLEKIGFKVEVTKTITSATINFSCEEELSLNEVLIIGNIIGHIEAAKY